jgi:hypothetical protein
MAVSKWSHPIHFGLVDQCNSTTEGDLSRTG